MVQVPVFSKDRVLPTVLQKVGVEDANVIGSPEVAMADSVRLPVFNPTEDKVANETFWLALPTVNLTDFVGASK